ncbi:methionyl-tRNA formyltransferase [bacterium]|nr:methionyl-tRNA formyltransferase [bacterium]
MDLKVIYWGASRISSKILSGLIKKNVKIVGVITYTDKPKGRGKQLKQMPVKAIGLENGLNVIEIDEINASVLEKINSLNPDLGIIMGFGILPKSLYEFPKLGTINLHPSLLPELRGAAPIKWALIRGLKKTGLTTFFLIDKIDAGNIILQEEFEITPDMDAGGLTEKVIEKGIQIIINSMDLIVSGDYKLKTQDDSRATKARKLKKEDYILDWNLKAEEIQNRVRAFSPEPGAVTHFRGELVKVFKTDLNTELPETKPGEIVEVSNKKGISVSTADGVIDIKKIQPAGKKIMDVQSYINGYHVKTGEFFK